ncbi:MAG: DegQ family serine endoprotease [Desulfarculaceae bacterium]|nr:DegQ family serine endoprotease [Desulfarculaceae bacterium]
MTLSKARLAAKPALVLLALIMALALAVPAGAKYVPDSFADLAGKVSPAVVNIRIVKTIKQDPMNGVMPFPGQQQGPDQEGQQGQPPDLHEFFRRFFGQGGPGGNAQPREFKQRALGSGVIVGPKGYVITNNHVVAGADEIIVRLKGGEEWPAKIIGRDPKTDLALIKIDAKHDLPFLPLGDSDKLRVGDWVLAVGNPFGLEHTVTAGIISAKGRIIGAGPYDNFLQTDASINPGNSGGPLINLQGQVVGINTAIAPQGQGIGFAIPVNTTKTIMAQLRDKGRVIRGWLGVTIQPVTKVLAEKFGLDEPVGALVADVVPGSPADKAGIKRGDVIIGYEGKTVKDMHALPRLVAETKVGSEVSLEVVREGKKRPLQVTIGELKAEAPTSPKATPQSEVKLGMGLQELTPDLAKQMGMAGKKGLIVTSVEQGGPAAEAGLMRGDVILEAAQKPVTQVSQFKDMAGKLKAGEGLLLLIQRRDSTLFLVIKSPDKK